MNDSIILFSVHAASTKYDNEVEKINLRNKILHINEFIKNEMSNAYYQLVQPII